MSSTAEMKIEQDSAFKYNHDILMLVFYIFLGDRGKVEKGFVNKKRVVYQSSKRAENGVSGNMT